jgi:galactose oxidase-like protein
MRNAILIVALLLVISGANRFTTAQEPYAAETLVGTWTNRTPATQDLRSMPKGAEDCAMIYDPIRDRVILAGGKDDGDFNQNEIWAFDIGDRVWTPLKTSGPKPPTSEDHTVIFDPIGYRMILYGGENGPTTNKLWALDLKTLTWRDLTSPAIPRRESHTAVYDSRGKRMLMFGGFDRTAIDLHDVWAMDLDPHSATFEKWLNLTVEAGRPPGRIDHSAVYDPARHRMVFSGGWSKGRKALFGDTWSFYIGDGGDASGRWEKAKTPAGTPPERRHAVAAYDSNRNLYIVFGGQGKGGFFLNDTWAFDLTRDAWMKVLTGDPIPAPRIDHQAVFDSHRGTVLVYGGDSGRPGGKLHDMWQLTLPPASTAQEHVGPVAR